MARLFTLWHSQDMADYFQEPLRGITINNKTIVYNMAYSNDTDHSIAWPDSKIVATNVNLN